MASLQLAIQGIALLVVLLAARWGSLVIPAGVPVSVVLFVLAAQLLVNLSTSLSVAFVGREWAIAHASTQMAGKGLRFAATVAVLIWAPDIRWVAAVLLVEGAAEIAVGAYILIVRRGVSLRRPDRATLRAYWSYARRSLITSPIGILQDSLDRILVARWAGLTAAGYYQVARVLWELLGTLNAYPFQLLLSRLSRLFATPGGKAAAETRRVFASAVDRLLFIAVPAAFGLWALRQPIVTLVYGERFLPAVDPLMVFVVAALAQAAFNPYQFILYAMDQHARFVPVVVLRLVVYLAGDGGAGPGLGRHWSGRRPSPPGGLSLLGLHSVDARAGRHRLSMGDGGLSGWFRCPRRSSTRSSRASALLSRPGRLHGNMPAVWPSRSRPMPGSCGSRIREPGQSPLRPGTGRPPPLRRLL